MSLKLQKRVFMQDEVVYLASKLTRTGYFLQKKKLLRYKMLKNQKIFLKLNCFWGCWTITTDIFKVLLIHFRWRWWSGYGKSKKKMHLRKQKNILDETNLIHHDPEKSLLLACNTSVYGLGTILSHRMPDGTPLLLTNRQGRSRYILRCYENSSIFLWETFFIIYWPQPLLELLVWQVWQLHVYSAGLS